MATNTKPTQFYATLSTSIVLVLIALFLLIFFHASNITNIVKENINILVELESNLPTGQINHLKSILSSDKDIIPSSIQFLSKEDAMTMMSKELNINTETEDNPFKDLLQFNLRHESYSDSKIQNIKSKVELEKGVLGLFYENDSVDLVKTNLEKISLAILLLAICFIILALAIIFNTIQLTLHADVKKIKTMQMVGAEKSFIKRPYLKNAFVMIMKAVLAVFIFLCLLCGYLIQSNSIFAEIIQWHYVLLTLIISFIAAMVIQFLTTNTIINAFLRKEGR